MDVDALALPTFVAAVVGTLLAGLGIVVTLVLRHRDRVELEITKVKSEGAYLSITVRNKGGTPTRLLGIYFVEGGFVESGLGGFAPLNGRSTVEIKRSFQSIGREAPTAPTAVYAMDEAGRKSKPFSLSEDIRKSISVSRPT